MVAAWLSVDLRSGVRPASQFARRDAAEPGQAFAGQGQDGSEQEIPQAGGCARAQKAFSKRLAAAKQP